MAKGNGILKHFFSVVSSQSNSQKPVIGPLIQHPLRKIRVAPAYLPTMRFVQFLRKNDNRKRLGAVSHDGITLVELSYHSCIAHDMISFIRQGISLAEIEQKIQNGREEKITDDYTLLPPITNPGKIICVGLNYKCHCEEQNRPIPEEPIFFSKFSNTLIGPTANVIAHKIAKRLDWEVELAVVIGKEGKLIPREKAMDYVFGYTIAQDITARDWQKRNGGQFLIGKSMDTFCPLGPCLVHKSLVPDVNKLRMTTLVNGTPKQCGSTGDMIFKIDDLISRLSNFITLCPGDVIITGTPKGVGMYRNPPEYLKPGDVIKSEIQCLGRLINRVIEI